MSRSKKKGYSEDSYLPTVDWGAISQSAQFDYNAIVNYLLEPGKAARFKAIDAKDVPLVTAG